MVRHLVFINLLFTLLLTLENKYFYNFYTINTLDSKKLNIVTLITCYNKNKLIFNININK